MTRNDKEQDIPSAPDFGIDPSEKVNRLKRFLETKKAVKRGERLFEFTKPELRARNYMGPWEFNLTESVFAALPALAALKVLDFLYPPHRVNYPNIATELSAEIMGWLAPILVPLSLLFIAKGAAFSSLLREDRSIENKRRATFAYLYYDGAHGLLAQAIFVLGLTIVYALIDRPVTEDASTALLAVFVPTYIIGFVWIIVISGKRIPNLLWDLHQYSA